MKNAEIARIFFEIADMLEIKGVEFKPRAYRKAAQNIEALPEDIADCWRQGRLREIPGVGEHIAAKIAEYLQTGKVSTYTKLKKELPVDFEGLGRVQGLGPKTIKLLYQRLKIRRLKELEAAARKGKLASVIGSKREANILASIGFSQQSSGRFLLGQMLPLAEGIRDLLAALPGVKRVEIGGSLRRMNETIGDIDLLAVAEQPAVVMERFTHLPGVKQVLARGQTKSSVRLDEGVQVDLRVVPAASWGAALQYFTGNKTHNVHVRKMAIAKGYKLSEYGLFKGGRRIAGKSEEEVYRRLGLPYIKPELREDTGEIDAALQGKLPRLVRHEDVHADLQMHTTYSDGGNSVAEMAAAAKKLGHRFIAITDHGGRLRIAGAMGEKEVVQQRREIGKIEGIRVFQGIEANVMKDGKLDVPPNILQQVDIVLAAVHSAFALPEAEMSKRLLAALDNRHVHILAHPTGRIIGRRPAYSFDFEKICGKAKEQGIALEINCHPERMDCNGPLVRKAVSLGVKLSIGTDSHAAEQLWFYRLGVALARRGWAEKGDVINTYNVRQIEQWLER